MTEPKEEPAAKSMPGTPENGYENLHEMIDSIRDYKFIEPSDEEIREYVRSQWKAK